MESLVKAVAIVIGFAVGWLVLFVVVHWALGWLPTPEYTGDPADIDARSHMESLRDLSLLALSVLIAIAGGAAGAMWVHRNVNHS